MLFMQVSSCQQYLECKRGVQTPEIIRVRTRGVRLAKNDFRSVFGSVLQKTAVFGSVLVLLN